MGRVEPLFFVYSGLFFIILELILGVNTGLDLFLAGVALLLGGGVFALTNVLWTAIATALLIIILYFVLFRAALRVKFVSPATTKVNIDRLIGREGIVIKEIKSSEAGQVKVDNEIWRAVAEKNLNKGEKVIINSVEGVTLKVYQKED